jgi:RNA polymerase sigma-70 factor, ECF subfamily
MDDASLARAAMDGHASAAAEVWDRFAPLVKGVLRRALGPDAEVEDITQEVFFALFRRLRAGHEASSLRGLIVCIAVRALRSELRRRRIRRWLRLTEQGQLPETSAPGEDLEAREAVRRLYGLLDRIDDEARLGFVLRHVQGLELDEVASGLGVSLATVKRRLTKVEARVLTMVEADPALRTYVTPPSRGRKGGQGHG